MRYCIYKLVEEDPRGHLYELICSGFDHDMGEHMYYIICTKCRISSFHMSYNFSIKYLDELFSDYSPSGSVGVYLPYTPCDEIVIDNILE